MRAPAGLRVRFADDHLLAVAGQQSRGAEPARVASTEGTVTRSLHWSLYRRYTAVNNSCLRDLAGKTCSKTLTISVHRKTHGAVRAAGIYIGGVSGQQRKELHRTRLNSGVS